MEFHAKGIAIRIFAEGEGIVNFDGKASESGQKEFLRNHSGFIGIGVNSNEVIGKHAIVTTGSLERIAKSGDSYQVPVVEIRQKVSSDCMRHEIFKDSMPPMELNASPEDYLPKLLAHTGVLLRGMMRPKNKSITLKRKSPFMITDLVQLDDDLAVPYVEVHSKEGDKTSKVDETGTKIDESTDANFFKKETIGLHRLSGKAYIDLSELQMVVADTKFGRPCILEEWITDFQQALKDLYNVDATEVGYYKVKRSMHNIGEKMVKLPDSFVTEMVKELIRNMQQVFITRAGAYLKVTKVEISSASPIDPFSDMNDWHTIDDQILDDLAIKTDSIYIRIPDEQAQAYNDEYKKAHEAQKEANARNKKK